MTLLNSKLTQDLMLDSSLPLHLHCQNARHLTQKLDYKTNCLIVAVIEYGTSFNGLICSFEPQILLVVETYIYGGTSFHCGISEFNFLKKSDWVLSKNLNNHGN